MFNLMKLFKKTKESLEPRYEIRMIGRDEPGHTRFRDFREAQKYVLDQNLKALQVAMIFARNGRDASRFTAMQYHVYDLKTCQYLDSKGNPKVK